MIEQVPHSCPWITEHDIEAVSATLASLQIGQGDQTRALEHRLAAWLHAADGVGVASGSAAIAMALHGLGVGSGDEVVLPTYVCRSVLQAVCSTGCTPVLSDVGDNWVMTADDVKKVCTTKTRAVVVPHIYGIFADIDSLRAFGVPIIEDCAQALDAPGKHPSRGDISVLSFHPTKCLTSGEGGMAISGDAHLVARMRTYRDGDCESSSPRYFSPLSDLAASLAMAQLDRYEAGLTKRRDIAAAYAAAIRARCPTAMNEEALGNSMHFRFPIRVHGGLAAYQQAFAHMGIQIRKGVDALLHRGIGCSDLDFPKACSLFDSTISMPIYPALTDSQIERCIEAINQLLPDDL